MSNELKTAIESGSIKEVSFLVDANVNVNRHFDDGMTPLNLAISIHEEEIATLLVDKGAMLNLPDSFRVDECRRCPIHYAAACNLFDMVCFLIKNGSSVNELDYGNSTPLHHAACHGNIDIVEYFLNLGSDINHQSKSGRTAIWKALQSGQEDVVHYLLTCGANVNKQNKVGETMLFNAVRQNNVSLIADIINFGADLNLKDIEENTVLHCASFLGKTESVEILLVPGSLNVNAGNEYGNTALHNSSMHDHVNTSLCLMNNGANINLLNKNGQSSLYLTMLHRRTNCTMLLHDAGARLTDREMRMYNDFEARKYDYTEMFYIWMTDYFRKPKLLTSLCVAVIRSNIKYPLDFYKSKLNLPKFLQEFVAMSSYKVVTQKDEKS